jgi:hypothetical protein
VIILSILCLGAAAVAFALLALRLPSGWQVRGLRPGLPAAPPADLPEPPPAELVRELPPPKLTDELPLAPLPDIVAPRPDREASDRRILAILARLRGAP